MYKKLYVAITEQEKMNPLFNYMGDIMQLLTVLFFTLVKLARKLCKTFVMNTSDYLTKKL